MICARCKQLAAADEPISWLPGGCFRVSSASFKPVGKSAHDVYTGNLTLTVNTITSQVRQHKRYVTWFHQTLSLAGTRLPHEYFPTRLKACNYCMQELQRVACNNCTWNHGIMYIIGRSVTAAWSLRDRQCCPTSAVHWRRGLPDVVKPLEAELNADKTRFIRVDPAQQYRRMTTVKVTEGHRHNRYSTGHNITSYYWSVETTSLSHKVSDRCYQLYSERNWLPVTLKSLSLSIRQQTRTHQEMR